MNIENIKDINLLIELLDGNDKQIVSKAIKGLSLHVSAKHVVNSLYSFMNNPKKNTELRYACKLILEA